MTALDRDLTSVLNCYVKRKSLGEIQFDKKQEESGVKVCEHIIHEHSRKDNGKDKLRLITQISHVSDNCDTPIPTVDAPPLNEKQNSSDVSTEMTPQISDYYLKCLSLSHIKSKSLDNDRDAKVDGYHRTKITAVVGDSSCKYERVHNTTLVHSANGHKIEKEYSFTRHVASSNSSSNSRPSSYYSLPSQIHHSSLIDKVNGTSKKKSGKKFKWKRLFSSSKSTQKKNELNLKEIDSLAMNQVQTLQIPPTTAPIISTIETDSVDGKWARQDSRKSNLVFNITQSLPFRSHPIGGKSLQPLYKDKKTKKVPNFFTSIMPSDNFHQKAHGKKSKIGHVKGGKKYTIDTEKGLDDKTKKIVADVSRCGDDEDFRYQINPDDLDYADGIDDDNAVFIHEGTNRHRSMSSNISISHLDMMRLSVKERRPSCPPSTAMCACRDRRIDVIVEFLRLVINKAKNEKVLAKLKAEIAKFNQDLCHFLDCPMIKCQAANNVSRDEESWRQSQASLYSTNSCLLCADNIDNQLNENFSPTLLPFLDKLESEEEINCPVETIEYFLRANCYKHFEKGLMKIIGVQCTMKNVALLHYLVRRIVKHVGDPADTDNKKIKTIRKYSEKFYLEHYYPHIKNIHKTMESFLISSNDNDDVD